MPILGTTERGENMKIGTYIEQSVDHEMSANIIDLCPVGALNNKPYRYSARAWEMVQRATVSPHDCVGSNMYAHVLRGTVKRIVPRENESINETWLADRDRFSYEAIYSGDRLQSPMIRTGERGSGQFKEVSWEEALDYTAAALLQIKDTYGEEALAVFGHTSGDHWFADHFAQAWGTPNAAKPSSALCLSPRDEAATLTYGSAVGGHEPVDWDDLPMPDYRPFLREAQELCPGRKVNLLIQSSRRCSAASRPCRSARPT